MKVSFYKNALATEGMDANPMILLTNIKNERWKEDIDRLRSLDKDEYDKQKKYLPAATFSGTFSPTRHDANLTSYTGIIIIDLDHVGDKLQEYKEKMTKSKNVLSVFTSPSGDGLKILVLTDITSDRHGDGFDHISKDIKKHLGVEVDKSGRNIARLCFVSSDPDIYINKDVVPMKLLDILPKEDVEPSGKKINSTDERVVVAERITRARHQFQKGSRNMYLHFLACCMNRLGVSYYECYNYIESEYHGYSKKEWEGSVKSAYKNRHEFNKWTIENVKEAPEVEYDEDGNNFRAESISEIVTNIFKPGNSSEGPKTFIPEVDDAIGGCMMRGNLYGMIGRDGTFKSIMAMYMSQENAKEGVSSIYFNMQMSKSQLVQRIIMRETGINILKGRRDGTLNESNKDNLLSRVKIIDENMFIVSDTGVAGTGLAEAIKREVAKRGNKDIQLIIIDDIGDMADEEGKGDMAVIANSRHLKNLAKEINAAVLCLSHTRTDCPKHLRNTGQYIRGGLKLTGNMDGYFCHSLLVDPSSNESMEEDIKYREGMFYMRFIDKRGAASEINKIITIGDNIRVDITDLNPAEYEIKLKR